MSAPRRPIQKYILPYRARYPGAEILVLESSLTDAALTSTKARIAKLGPALEVIAKHAKPEGERSTTVLHAFSNGGAGCAVQVVGGLAEGMRLEAWRAVVLDSCPGKFSYGTLVEAVSLSLPRKGWLGWVSWVAVHGYACAAVVGAFLGGGDAIERLRVALNDPVLFGGEVPRLYLFSDGDALVEARDVEDHVEDAKGKRFVNVRARRFAGSGHCAHVVGFGEEYWNLVEEAVEGRGAQDGRTGL